MEKSFSEIKEAHDIIKSKYETLKKIVNQNELASRIFSLTNPFPTTKGVNTSMVSTNANDPKEKEESKLELIIPSKGSFSMPSTKNIVRPIKGGQGQSFLLTYNKII